MELAQVTKSNKELSQQISTIGGDRDKLQQRLQEAVEQVDDLKEQVCCRVHCRNDLTCKSTEL